MAIPVPLFKAGGYQVALSCSGFLAIVSNTKQKTVKQQAKSKRP
jgi:hypothetical protein